MCSTTTMSSSKQQQQQLVNNLSQLGYGSYLTSQQSALDSLLTSQGRSAYSQPPAAHSNSNASTAAAQSHHVRNTLQYLTSSSSNVPSVSSNSPSYNSATVAKSLAVVATNYDKSIRAAAAAADASSYKNVISSSNKRYR